MSEEEGEMSSPPNENAMVKEVVQAMMILDRSKKPFKYSDIAFHLTHKPSRTGWAKVIRDAANRLESMGLTLHEVKNAYTKMFFIVCETCPFPSMYKYASKEEVSDRILLTLVLTYIFMKQGVVYTEDMFCHLKTLGIYKENVTSHPYFGNVGRKILTEFVEKLYLSVTKVANSELIEIKWGQRAELEITKRSILEFVCKCGFRGLMTPELFTSHYKKVKEEEVRVCEADPAAIATDNADADDNNSCT